MTSIHNSNETCEVPPTLVSHSYVQHIQRFCDISFEIRTVNYAIWYVKMYLRGQNRNFLTRNILKTTIIFINISEQKLFRIKFLITCTFHIVLFGPFRWLQVQQLKLTCSDKSRTIRDRLNTCWTRNYIITEPFFWYQAQMINIFKKGPRYMHCLLRGPVAIFISMKQFSAQ